MKTNKKILFFHHASHLGGATISGLNLLEAIPKDKYNLIVYCNTKLGFEAFNLYSSKGFDVIAGGPSPVAFLHYSGDELFILSVRAMLTYYRIFKDKKRIRNIIKKNKPDIVIVNSMTLFWIAKIAKKDNVETICFSRETIVNGLFGFRTYLIKRSINKYVDKIAFLSRFDLEQMEKLKIKKVIIYNTINLVRLNSKPKRLIKKQLGLDEKTNYVLYVGGFYKLKGVHVLIKAINELNRNNVQFIFVGVKWQGAKKISQCKTWVEKIRYLTNLDFEKKSINMIYNHSIIPKLKFYPPQTDLSPFYDSSDLLVFPMTVPHQARPLIEAGYSKLPVLVTDFPNIKEFIDENSGYVFPNGDHKVLAEKIDYILNNIQIAKSKAKQNYLITKKRHSFEEYSIKIQNLLES